MYVFPPCTVLPAWLVSAGVCLVKAAVVGVIVHELSPPSPCDSVASPV